MPGKLDGPGAARKAGQRARGFGFGFDGEREVEKLVHNVVGGGDT